MEIECIAPVVFQVSENDDTTLLENHLILKKEYGNARLVSGDGMIWLLGAHMESTVLSSSNKADRENQQPTANQAPTTSDSTQSQQQQQQPQQKKQKQVREIKITSLRNSSFSFRLVERSEQVTAFLQELQQQIDGKQDLVIKKKRRKIRKKLEQDLAIGFQPVNTLNALKSPVKKLPPTTPPRTINQLHGNHRLGTSPALFSPKRVGVSFATTTTTTTTAASPSPGRLQSPLNIAVVSSPFRSPFRKKRNVHTTPTHHRSPVLLPSLDDDNAATASAGDGSSAAKTPSPAVPELSSSTKRKEWLSPLREQKKRVGLSTPTRLPLQQLPLDTKGMLQLPPKNATPTMTISAKTQCQTKTNANGIVNATGRSCKRVRSLQFDLEQIPGPSDISERGDKDASTQNALADNSKQEPNANKHQTALAATTIATRRAHDAATTTTAAAAADDDVDKENDRSIANTNNSTLAELTEVSAQHNLSPSKVHGLLNLGNFCYMNAIIQALASLSDFVHALENEEAYLLSLQRHLLRVPNNTCTTTTTTTKQHHHLITVETPLKSTKHGKSKSTTPPLVTQRATMTKKTWTQFKKDQASQLVVQPSLTRILQLVTNGSDRFINPDFLKHVMGAKNALFATAMQQDAHEFLLNLLNEVEMEMLRNAQTMAKRILQQEQIKQQEAEEVVKKSYPQAAQASLLNFFTSSSSSSSSTEGSSGGKTKSSSSSPSPLGVDETQRASRADPVKELDPIQQFVGELPPAHFFRTQLERRLTCCSCGFTRKTIEMFFDFSLDFLPRKPMEPRRMTAAAAAAAPVVSQAQAQAPAAAQQQQQQQQVPDCLCGKPSVLYGHEDPSKAYFMCKDHTCALRVSLLQFHQRVAAARTSQDTNTASNPTGTTDIDERVKSSSSAASSDDKAGHSEAPQPSSKEVQEDEQEQDEQVVHLETLLQRHFEPTRFELTCEKCATGREVLCDYQVRQLPKVLVFHLKRFELDLQSSEMFYKRCDRVQAPVRLEPQRTMIGTGDMTIQASSVSSSSSSSPVYQLRSVVHHLGRNVDQGHYMTDVCVQKPNAQREWKRYNDTFVSEISEEQAVGPKYQESCYMLFYVLDNELQ